MLESSTLETVEARGARSDGAQKSGKNQRWFFPLRYELTKRSEFLALSIFEKLTLLDMIYQIHHHAYLVNQGTRQGPFCWTDAWWSRRLRMSLEAFRNAR